IPRVAFIATTLKLDSGEWGPGPRQDALHVVVVAVLQLLPADPDRSLEARPHLLATFQQGDLPPRLPDDGLEQRLQTGVDGVDTVGVVLAAAAEQYPVVLRRLVEPLAWPCGPGISVLGIEVLHFVE